MATYKVSGTSSDNATIYVLQGNGLVGYKDNNYGNYNIVADVSTPSGIDVVAKNPDGQIVGFGGVTAVATGDASNITAVGSVGINSVYRGVFTIPAETIGPVLVNIGGTVDMSKTSIDYLGWYNTNQSTFWGGCLYLANTTQLAGLTANNLNWIMTLSYQVVEYVGGINVQRGIINIPSGSQYYDYTIEEVDTSKTQLKYLGSGMVGSTASRTLARIDLINSTTVRAYRGDTIGNSNNHSFEIVEF